MSKARYAELLGDIRSGAALKRWPEDKKPRVKKEHVEMRQLALISELALNGIDLDKLLKENWRVLEVYDNGRAVWR